MEVKYTDLDGEAAQKKVAEYNEQGKKAMPTQSSHNYRDNRSKDYDRRRRDDGKHFFFFLVAICYGNKKNELKNLFY